jgi:hypothetical protein
VSLSLSVLIPPTMQAASRAPLLLSTGTTGHPGRTVLLRPPWLLQGRSGFASVSRGGREASFPHLREQIGPVGAASRLHSPSQSQSQRRLQTDCHLPGRRTTCRHVTAGPQLGASRPQPVLPAHVETKSIQGPRPSASHAGLQEEGREMNLKSTRALWGTPVVPAPLEASPGKISKTPDLKTRSSSGRELA